MTQEERLAIIKNRAALNEQKEQDVKNQFQKECEGLVSKIEKMKDHIVSLLELTNACVENNIKLPDNRGSFSQNYTLAEPYGYRANFYGDGVSHNVGLGKTNYHQSLYDAIVIRNGGACGPWDLIVDKKGKVTFQSGKDTLPMEQWTDTQKRNLESFIKQFPKLEHALFNYIESLDDKPHVWAKVEWGDRSEEQRFYNLPKSNRIFIPEEVYSNAENENEAYELIETYLRTTYQAKVYTFTAENLDKCLDNKELDEISNEER